MKMPLAKAPGAVMTPPDLARGLARGDAGSPWAPGTPVLDPACGEGELLLAAFEASGADPRWAERSLHGIELDPARLARARERLARAVGGEAGRRAAAHLLLGDALDPGVPWPPGTAILANPPWASLSGRQAVDIPAEQRARWRARSDGPGGWPSLHGAFLDRIAAHVAREGTGARILLPAPVAEGERYGPLREAVTARVRLTAVPTSLGEDAFPDVVEPALSLELAPYGPRPVHASALPWVERSPEDQRFLDHLATFPRLPAECFSDPGVHTGNAAADLIVRADAPDLPPIREGRDLAPFHLGPPTARLRADHAPHPGQHFRIAPLERYTSTPILIRQTANRPIAALHTEPTYFRNTLLACTPPPDLDPAFVVAVLNSELIARWHRLSFADARQRTFPQVKVRHLRAVPFPITERNASRQTQEAIVGSTRSPDAHGKDPETLLADLFAAPG